MYATLVKLVVTTTMGCQNIVDSYLSKLHTSEETLADIEAALVKKQPHISAGVKKGSQLHTRDLSPEGQAWCGLHVCKSLGRFGASCGDW